MITALSALGIVLFAFRPYAVLLQESRAKTSANGSRETFEIFCSFFFMHSPPPGALPSTFWLPWSP